MAGVPGLAEEGLEAAQPVARAVAGAGVGHLELEVLAEVAQPAEHGAHAQPGAHAPYLTGEPALEGLEVGVAGLVYALSAAGMFPAASCRGHVDPDSWSAVPVVMFAADRVHAEALRPLVESSRCGFDLDPIRPELLVINGRSAEDTLRLGRAVLASIETFRSLG